MFRGKVILIEVALLNFFMLIFATNLVPLFLFFFVYQGEKTVGSVHAHVVVC